MKVIVQTRLHYAVGECEPLLALKLLKMKAFKLNTFNYHEEHEHVFFMWYFWLFLTVKDGHKWVYALG